MPGRTSLQRLSIYADDVVLFIRPLRMDLIFAGELRIFGQAEIFGQASALDVNFIKSWAILILVDKIDQGLVVAALPWKMDDFPCKYLGLY